MLGDVYSELGRWREALGVMRIAADRFPNDPAARQLRADMSTLFERLFLDGEADQLQPIEALGLFYEFSDLTPVGPNGDRIVRLLAGRLVKVDLLEQAAQLLQHQVDERLQGMGKAQVAADLAAIYLMDHKPDQALVAIDTSRQPNMPTSLLADRRILEARALLGLGPSRWRGGIGRARPQRRCAARARGGGVARARLGSRGGRDARICWRMRDATQPMDAGDRQEVLRAGDRADACPAMTTRVRALYRQYAGDMAAHRRCGRVRSGGVRRHGGWHRHSRRRARGGAHRSARSLHAAHPRSPDRGGCQHNATASGAGRAHALQRAANPRRAATDASVAPAATTTPNACRSGRINT